MANRIGTGRQIILLDLIRRRRVGKRRFGGRGGRGEGVGGGQHTPLSDVKTISVLSSIPLALRACVTFLIPAVNAAGETRRNGDMPPCLQTSRIAEL